MFQIRSGVGGASFGSLGLQVLQGFCGVFGIWDLGLRDW